MPNLCIRCALRIRIAEARTPISTTRAFSSTPTRRKSGLPKFTETSQPELDDVLASLRYKHLLPAALSNAERNLIFKPKHKQQLIDYPVAANVGDESITLQHIDRMSDVPSLKRELIPKAIKLMAEGAPADWNQLPAMLAGLKKAKMTPRDAIMGKIARKAVEAGRFGIVLQCLQQASTTEMTLKRPEVLYNVLYALRQLAQQDRWSEQAAARAIRDANEIAMLLEDESHGTGKVISPIDPRTNPRVLGVFLELSAVYAYKHQDGKDVDGKVRAYAERLLFNIRSRKKKAEEAETQAGGSTLPEGVNDVRELVRIKASVQPSTTKPRPTGPQIDILKGVPIWHGLRLSQKILGEDMPTPELAQEVVQHWGAGLGKLMEGLKVQVKEKKKGPKGRARKEKDTYDGQALRVYGSCLKIQG